MADEKKEKLEGCWVFLVLVSVQEFYFDEYSLNVRKRALNLYLLNYVGTENWGRDTCSLGHLILGFAKGFCGNLHQFPGGRTFSSEEYLNSVAVGLSIPEKSKYLRPIVDSTIH